MSLECPACHVSHPKLKQLSNCHHSFCTKCLDPLVSDGSLACPTCEKESAVPSFGVKGLQTVFGGEMNCTSCQVAAELCNMVWCQECQDILCRPCSLKAEHAAHHTELEGHHGPWNYSIKVIEKYAELHTNLCQMQKGIVNEYFMKAQEGILKMLDHDLTERLDKFKSEKRKLEEVFETSFKDTELADSSFLLNGNKYVNYLRKLQEVGKMKNARKPSELAASTGVVFKPPSVEQLVKDLTIQGNVTGGTAISYRDLMPPSDTKGHVIMHLGSGALSHPCDLAILPEKHQVIVASTNSGLTTMNSGTGEVVSRLTANPTQQFACLEHCLKTKKFYVASLEDFKTWKIRIFSDSTCRQEVDCIDCPEEPKIDNAWYRWLTLVDENLLIVSAGDKKASALWLCKLPTKEWSLISQEDKSTYRRAAVRHFEGKDVMIYVPDMQQTRIKTFTLKPETAELTGFSQINYDELKTSIPVAIDVCNDLLVIGFWLTGHVVLADMTKGSSKTIACVGPRELLTLRIVDGRLYALLKNLEVVQVYGLSKVVAT